MSDRIRIVQVSGTHFGRKCAQARTCGWVVRRGHTSEHSSAYNIGTNE